MYSQNDDRKKSHKCYRISFHDDDLFEFFKNKSNLQINARKVTMFLNVHNFQSNNVYALTFRLVVRKNSN